MEIVNYSEQQKNRLISWLPKNLEFEKVIFFPDVCPGKSSLPTGTVVLTKKTDWRQFAVSDCGCGMLLLKSSVKVEDFDHVLWDQIYYDLKNNKGKLGDLGSGNHFLDALEPYSSDFIHFLIHTGSRTEGKNLQSLTGDPEAFDEEHQKIRIWAEENRKAIAEI